MTEMREDLGTDLGRYCRARGKEALSETLRLRCLLDGVISIAARGSRKDRSPRCRGFRMKVGRGCSHLITNLRRQLPSLGQVEQAITHPRVGEDTARPTKHVRIGAGLVLLLLLLLLLLSGGGGNGLIHTELLGIGILHEVHALLDSLLLLELLLLLLLL